MAPLIYVINLDRDAERLASIRDNLDRLGLRFERLPAVMGKDVPEWEKLVDLPTYAWRNRLDVPRAGEVGCYLSHLKAMETFLKTDAPWCVIHSGMPVKKRELAGGHKLVAHLTRTTSSAAYVVNRRAAESLLRSMLPITEQVDHALDRPWETGLRTRGIRPMPVVLAPVAHTTSTIGYQDKGKARRPLGKSLKLFLSRAKKEISRFGYGLVDAVRG
jgi:glycosyl transferase family 25